MPKKKHTFEERVCLEIHRQRVALGISQTELANRSGLHRSYIGDLENKGRNISVANLSKIAAALGSKASRLVANAEQPLPMAAPLKRPARASSVKAKNKSSKTQKRRKTPSLQRHKMNVEQVHLAEELLGQGVPYKKVAARFGVHFGTMYRTLREVTGQYRLPPTSNKQFKMTEQQVRLAEKLLSQGIPYREVAERFGVHFGTIFRRLRELTGKYRQPPGVLRAKMTEKQVRRAKKLLSQGVPYKQVAAKFGVHFGTMYRTLRKLTGENRQPSVKTLSQAEKESVLQLLRDGKTYLEIAEILDQPYWLVRRVRIKEGEASRRGPPLKMTPDKLLLAEKLLNEQRPAKEVAALMGVAESTLYRYVKIGSDRDRRKAGKVRRLTVDEVKLAHELKRQGYKCRDVAAHFGITDNVVWECLRKAKKAGLLT